MKSRIRFALLRPERLRIHEEIVPERVEALVQEIRGSGRVEQPILVARGSGVVLDGHHRFEALRRLGVSKVPAWVVDYEDTLVQLDRWDSGPALSKSDVVERARAGRPFPPKTSRHRILIALPARPVRLEELMTSAARRPGSGRRARATRPGPAAPRPE
ncbi:MAG: ParB N-terminal domain-containing protein [Thermoplasmata archaeon]|nr:ParB N-terminal domain-containing protein [Thermoplasmata archaeon]